MKTTLSHACLVLLIFVLTSGAALAQGKYNETIPAGSGTLSYAVTVALNGCRGTAGGGNTSFSYTSTYSDFSYKVSGTTTSLTGSDVAEWILCSPESQSTPSITLFAPSVAIVFTPDIGSAYNGGTATTIAPSIFYPAYQVTSIIYAPPGNKSTSGFTTSLTDGTTTTVGSSFTAGSSITYTSGGDFLGLGGTVSVTYGNSNTTGNSNAFTETFTDATSISLASQSSNPNAISHGQDLFLIWLNPAISIYPTSTKAAGYSAGTQTSASGTPEEVDFVEVSAITMEANSSGVTTVPGAILGPQDDASGNPTLPGLALICATHTLYPNCTTANQCGCVPADFAAILALDPLLKYTTTESPLNADTSGATACANPTVTDKCRYVPVLVPLDPPNLTPTTPDTQKLMGPECQGCDIPTNMFVVTDSDTTTQTLSQTAAQTVAYTWKVDLFDEEGGPTLTSGNQFTWTEMESTGEINGTANSMMVTFSSDTVGCSQVIPIFEDTVFHTFVFQQPANNTTCP
jgi:hypothetical protein